MAKVGRKWEKELYRISKLRNTDRLWFEHKAEIGEIPEADRFYFNILNGNKVLRIKNELRAGKEDLARKKMKCKIKGLEQLLYAGVNVYDISVERDGKVYTFDEICMVKNRGLTFVA
ncbi:MAG: hypothetical protein FWF51_09795 [Chitinivibrionia bacterium]|nr:hypothetical protein [Chitinivibrionia bacterium]